MEEINTNEVRFTMRMDAALYEELKEEAKLNRRSVAKELENIVDIHLHKDSYIQIPEPISKKLEEYIRNWLEEHSNETK